MSTIITVTSNADIKALRAKLKGLGLWTKVSRDATGMHSVLRVEPHSKRVARATIESLEGVLALLEEPSAHPKLDQNAGRQVVLQRHGVRVTFGGGAEAVLAAGPCAAESEAQIHDTALMVAQAGGRLLRGGAFKPRTSPYAFSGNGREALGWLRDAADAHGLLLVTELMSESDVSWAADQIDLVQIGSRNMQNYALLRAVGESGAAVLLKRGSAANLSTWRLAAEHLLHAGARDVILCERGIAGPDVETRNVLDLGAVALLKQVDGLVVMVDPSHAGGRRDLVVPLSKAALAVGADGLLVEVQPNAADA